MLDGGHGSKVTCPREATRIPKTAGTSFIHYLMKQVPREQIAPVYVGDINAIGTDNPAFKVFWGHFYYREIRPLVPSGFYVTFLRDPIARAFSQYKSWHNPANLPPGDPWRERMTPEQIADIELAQKLSFDEFVLAGKPRFDDQLIGLQALMLSDYPKESVSWKESAESAKVNLSQFDFVGLVERFDDSLALLRKQFPQFGEYALLTESENRGIQADSTLSDAARRRLEGMLEADMALYEYGKVLFEERFKSMSATPEISPGEDAPLQRGYIRCMSQGDEGLDVQVFDGQGNWLSIHSHEGKQVVGDYSDHVWTPRLAPN